MTRLDAQVLGGHRRSLVVSLGLLLALGCSKSEDMPVTHPVSGKVMYKDGQPVQGGAIQFTPTDAESTLLVSGETDETGSFTLSTLKGNKKATGAPEGKYEVTVVPPQPSDHQRVPPVMLPKPVTIKPGENVLSPLTIPRPPKGRGAPPQ